MPFTEYIEPTGAIAVSIGHYSKIDDWSYYNDINASTGGSTAHEDLGVSFFFDTYNLEPGHEKAIGGLKFGIKGLSSDSNITSLPYEFGTITKIEDLGGVNIQCSDETYDKIKIPLVTATAEGLGFPHGHLDISGEDEATEAIDLVSSAIKKASSYRTNFGERQNRLEHAYNINKNSSENTQYAESQIRDTDMALEMTRLSKENILEQAGQTMLAQANNSNQDILRLLL